MSQSTNLQLPYLAAGQAQRHVTVNESLRRLDALVLLTVESASVSAEPPSPGAGQRWILPAGKSGTHWGALSNNAVAYWRDGAWEEITPRQGWTAYVKDAGAELHFDGAAWTQTAHHFETGLTTAAFLPSPGNSEIWRLDAARTATPRAFTIDSVSGAAVTLTTASVNQIFGDTMRDRARVRVWNTSKSPAQSAWVDYNTSTTQVRVASAADVAGWAHGETLQLGDPNPTAANTLQMVAIDLGNYMQNNLGAVFPQKAAVLSLYVASTGGSASLQYSGTGAGGTAYGGNSLSDGVRNQSIITIPTPTPSPISNSNLLFLRETLDGGASNFGTALSRILGLFV